MAKQKPKLAKRSFWKLAIFVVICGLVLTVIAPQTDQLWNGLKMLQDAQLGLIALAQLCVLGAVLASAQTYRFLAFKSISSVAISLVQVAGMFVNRLLPAGVGGMGLAGRFLYKRGHTAAQSTAIPLVNNALTGFGHMVLLLIAIVFFGMQLPGAAIDGRMLSYIFCGVVLAAGSLYFLAMYSSVFRSIQKFVKSLLAAFRAYQGRPVQLASALVFAIANTTFHTLALYCCMLAFSVDLSLVSALLVLTGGIAVASATPTPGGVLGAEAGLAAAMVGLSVSAPAAVAVAVSYRIVSYWIPLLPGALAFFYIQKQKLI